MCFAHLRNRSLPLSLSALSQLLSLRSRRLLRHRRHRQCRFFLGRRYSEEMGRFVSGSGDIYVIMMGAMRTCNMVLTKHCSRASAMGIFLAPTSNEKTHKSRKQGMESWS